MKSCSTSITDGAEGGYTQQVTCSLLVTGRSLAWLWAGVPNLLQGHLSTFPMKLKKHHPSPEQPSTSEYCAIHWPVCWCDLSTITSSAASDTEHPYPAAHRVGQGNYRLYLPASCWKRRSFRNPAV